MCRSDGRAESVKNEKNSYKKERIIEPVERKGLIKNLTKI